MASLTETRERQKTPKAKEVEDLANPQSSLKSQRHTIFIRLGFVTLLSIAFGLLWWLYASGREETDDAYVDGHISNVSCKINGNVSQVFVDDNQLVKAGSPLVQIDPVDYQVKVNQAKASLEAAQHTAIAAYTKIIQSSLSSQGQTRQASGDVSSVQAQITASRSALLQDQAATQQAQAKVEECSAQVNFAAADFERYQKVYVDRVVTKQQFDKAKEAHDIAIAQLKEAKQNLLVSHQKELQAQADLKDAQGRLQRSLGGITSALASVHQKTIDQQQYESYLAECKKAEADLEQAQLQLSYTHITAPVPGRVGRKSVEIGQHVESGQVLMALVQENPWITANFKETQVGRMHSGQTAEIKIDSFPGHIYKGMVDSISPASGAKFSILPPDNASGNFTKVVQRVPVKIVFDPRSIQSIKNKIAPGMSCIVTVLVKK